jgi:glutamate-ammonia-ligase adenylyltransferase
MTFGSDLDLIFLVDTDSNSMDQSVFRKLRKLLRSLSAVSSFGVLYEVDMRLRPHGNAGALLTHASSFVEYHQQNRQTWERQMMTRVRVIMDDDILGAESLAKISPFIFGQYDEDELKSDILEMRIRVENEKGKQANTLNVKQGRGGIMDIDFICHYFQLLHGDEKPQFRSSSTRIILQELQQSEILGLSESDILLKSYDFLKRIETCVRLFDLKAISALQVDGKMMRAICRAMGFSDNIDQFQHAYSQVTNQVREIFHQHLGS